MNAERVTILLMDDQPLVAAGVRRLFAHVPEFSVRYCPQAKAVLAEAEALAEECVVVLLDMQMPEISGVEMVRLLRTAPRTANLPIVMLSAEEDSASKAAAFDAGADDYVLKLPDPIEMVARIRALIRRVRR